MPDKKKIWSERHNYLNVWRAFVIIAVLGAAVSSLGWLKTFGAQRKVPFHIEEATISDIQSALITKRITTVLFTVPLHKRMQTKKIPVCKFISVKFRQDCDVIKIS